MAKVNFSVVATVYNEEDSIVALLDSLINQSLLPSEIVLVDGGSSDSTIPLITEKAKESKVTIKVLKHPGLNRSEGRNIGIEKAENEHIAVTDAGCEADKYWLEELSDKFKDGTESVAGYYMPVINQPIQKLFAAYVALGPKNFNPDTYLPSSRSLAFTKKVWKQAGKYPESLETCEDLIFARNLKNLGTMSVNHKALVYWRQADGMESFFKQIRGYAEGDVIAGYRPHLKKIATVWLRYVVFLLFPPLFLIYIFYPFWKFKHEVRGVQDGLVLPLVQITADWAIMVGSAQGFMALIPGVRTKT